MSEQYYHLSLELGCGPSEFFNFTPSQWFSFVAWKMKPTIDKYKEDRIKAEQRRKKDEEFQANSEAFLEQLKRDLEAHNNKFEFGSTDHF